MDTIAEQMTIGEVTGNDVTHKNDMKLASSPAIHKLYMVLALHHENIVTRVFKHTDPDQSIEEAEAEVRKLLASLPGKCPNGYMWSEKLGRCVPILI